MKFRKKPVVIEAFQYDGDLRGSDGNYYVPEWAVNAYNDEIIYYDSLLPNEPPCELFIKTLECVCHASVGDYIIQGANGELYPCKPDIFENTYDNVGSEEANKSEIGLEDISRIIGFIRSKYDEDYLDGDCGMSVDYAEGAYDVCNEIIRALKKKYCK